MTTSVAQSAATIEFDVTLRILAERARSAYGGEGARITRGLALALNGHVTLHADGSAHVRSENNPDVHYKVAHGICDCPDGIRAPGGRCKHRWSVCLIRKAQHLAPPVVPPQRFYATYYAPSGAMIPGLAEDTPRGPLFIPDDGGEPVYAALTALCLGGNVALSDAQREADGDLVRKICGY